MNWDIQNLKLESRDFESVSITIKSIKKFTPEEKNKLVPESWDNKLWPYLVEFEEEITYANNRKDNKLFVFKNTFYWDSDNEATAHQNADVFYFFIHHLTKKVEIPFRRFYNNKNDKESFFCLSDKVNNTINLEKKKWDDLGYTSPDDFSSANKWKVVARKEKTRQVINKIPDELYKRINVVENEELNKRLEGKIAIEESNQPSVTNYQAIYPNIDIDWKDSRGSQPSILPLRLINIQKKEIENVIPSPSSFEEYKNYAILSYSWGSWKNEKGESDEKHSEISSAEEGVNNTWYEKYKDKLKEYPNTYKSLLKAAKACQLKEIGIDYFWMDQFCIDQGSIVEINQEMPKMRRYYGNSTLTLVAIQTELKKESKKSFQWLNSQKVPNQQINTSEAFDNALDTLGIIMRSIWRFSSWTYQEGWLSKQTIFMFDDILVDGRFLAMVWAQGAIGNQPENTEEELKGFEEFRQKYRGRYATPIGWAYEEEKKLGESAVSLSLTQSLIAMKGRRRWYPIEGIYTVLGLLPYGNQVKVDISKSPEEALLEIMKIAVQNGYGEPLAWFGSGSSYPKDWLPKIERVGTSVAEKNLDVFCAPGTAKFTEDGVMIMKRAIEYPITKVGGIVPYERIEESSKFFYRLNKNNEIEKDSFSKRKVTVNNNIEIILEGTKETLGEPEKEGKIDQCKLSELALLIPDERDWKAVKIENGKEWKKFSFALLVKKTARGYRRIGLVKLEESGNELERKVDSQLENQFEAHIEVVDKKISSKL